MLTPLGDVALTQKQTVCGFIDTSPSYMVTHDRSMINPIIRRQFYSFSYEYPSNMLALCFHDFVSMPDSCFHDFTSMPDSCFHDFVSIPDSCFHDFSSILALRFHDFASMPDSCFHDFTSLLASAAFTALIASLILIFTASISSLFFYFLNATVPVLISEIIP